MTCYKRKLTVWPENRFFPKITPKNSLFDKNQHHPTLEGPGGQTIDSRAISGLPLKTWGHNCSNWQCGRSMASKLSPQQADKFFLQVAMEIREKRKFFSLRPPARKRREISGWVQWVKWCPHIGQQMHCWQTVAAGSFWPCFACPKLGDAGKTRVASKNREVFQKLGRPQFWL